MKKFLSLVLALTMVLSLFTMTTMASATDFTDDESITYQEAIDVISAIGVVSGYSDGSFKPNEPLTRGAAAKIITNLILGPSTASTLVCTVAPFPDVPANHTFAAAITYCSQNKIINGYGNGNFVPDGTLTGFAFLKMLLGALGYDGTIEGFTGANWSINVAKLADGIGLTDKVAEGFSGTSAVDRQTACLFAFNTIKADLVEYDNRITANVGGVDVAIGGNNTAKSVMWQTQATRTNTITNDDIVQFGERYFSRLVRNGGGYKWNDSYTVHELDNMARPATKWTWRGNDVGTYADEPVLTYDGSKKITEIYNDLKLSSTADGWLFINGNPYDLDDGYIEIKRTDDTKLSKLSEQYTFDATLNPGGDDAQARIGDGTIVEVFYNDRTNEVIISAQSVYGGKVTSVKDANSKKDAYVTVDYGTAFPEGITGKNKNEFVTSEFKVDDVVAYTYSDAKDEIASMYKMESVEGTLSKATTGKNITLGDTTYKYAQDKTFADGLQEGDLSNNSKYIVYTDKNGYALWIEEAEFSADVYALVLGIEKESSSSSGSLNSNRARLLFSDGTRRVVDLDKEYDVNVDDVIRFRTKDNGEYRLYEVAGTDGAISDFSIQDKKLNGTFDGKTISNNEYTVDGNYVTFVDSKTIFVVNENNEYNVYTGIRNAPDVRGADHVVAYADKNGVAKVVYIMNGQVVSTSKAVTFIAGESVSKLIFSSDGADYYTYNAVVKGEITTVMIKAESEDVDGIDNLLKPGSKANLILNQTAKDADDKIVSAGYASSSVSRGGPATGVGAVRNGDEIRLGTWDGEKVITGRSYTLASNVVVYLVDDGGDIEKIEVSDITANPKNNAMWTMDDGEITNLFIIETESD